MSVRLLLVGGGRMGEALLGGMLAAGRDPSEFAVAEVYAPRRAELAEKYPGVQVVAAPVAAEGVVLATKPGDLAARRARRSAGGRAALPLRGRGHHLRGDRGRRGRTAPGDPRDAQHAGARRRRRHRDCSR